MNDETAAELIAAFDAATAAQEAHTRLLREQADHARQQSAAAARTLASIVGQGTIARL